MNHLEFAINNEVEPATKSMILGCIMIHVFFVFSDMGAPYGLV